MLYLQPVFSGATWESDQGSRPILGLTSESVRDLLLLEGWGGGD